MLAELLLSCEHATFRIPLKFKPLLKISHSLARSHFGYDFGAIQILSQLKKLSGCPSVSSRVSRLLVDCNRSKRGRKPFSKYSQNLNSSFKKDILKEYFFPYREELENLVLGNKKRRIKTIHISVHSFTPILNGVKRDAHIGLLYDPKRKEEKMICNHIHRECKLKLPTLKIRRNYPYLGISDGLTSHLRKIYGEKWYLGVEVEFNQGLFSHGVRKGVKEVLPLLQYISSLHKSAV